MPEQTQLEIYKDVIRGNSVDGFIMDVFEDDEGVIPANLTGYDVIIEHRNGSKSGKLLARLDFTSLEVRMS